MAKPKQEPNNYPHDDLIRGVDVSENEEWYPAYGEAKLIYGAWQKATNTEKTDEPRDDHKIFGAHGDD